MMTIQIEESKDRKIGVITSGSTMLLIIIALYFTTFLIGTPVPADIPPLKSDEVIEEFQIDNVELESGGGSGSGTPSNDKVDAPKEQSQHYVTQASSNTHVFSGNSHNNTGHNATNASSTTTQSNNPFGTGGDGGGNGSGSGTGFGNDKGNGGEGPGGNGNGNGKGRTRLNNLNTDHIQSSENATIYLTLTINADGKVVSAKSISSKTTTTDTRLINQFISAVKDQIKYNKDPGAGLVSVYFSAKLIAN
jgi:hypothetical protein